MRPIAIMAAMEQEAAELRDHLVASGRSVHGGREFLSGTLRGVPVVLVRSRWGKVAAAVTATHLINHYRPSSVLFVGIAGSLSPSVRIGDVVVADTLVQHDMDASPLFPRYVVPLLGAAEFRADPQIRDRLADAADRFLADLPQRLPASVREAFGLARPSRHVAQIATGDQFVRDPQHVARLNAELSAVCVEMEGAAVAQVCHEHEVPFGVLRVISDNADSNAHVDFDAFLDRVAARYCADIVREYLRA